MNSVVSGVNSVATSWALRSGPSRSRFSLQNKQLQTGFRQYARPGGRRTRRGRGL